MLLLSLSVLLVLLVSAEGSVGPSSNSSFCTESRECLEYELVCRTDEYEVRHYSPTRWVSTDAEAYFMGVGAAMAFRRLFQYISGANEGGVQMEMTAPVLVKIPEETRMWEPAIYSLNFPLPAAYQEKPPAPTNDKLYFSDMPEMDVYVRSYGGWMLSVTSRLHAHLLTKELGRVGAAYNHSFHYGVGYDSPLKLLNRHNEVWYLAEGELVCSDPQEPTPAHRPRPTQTQTQTQTQSDSPAPSPTLSNQSTSNPSESPAPPSDAPPSPSSDPPNSTQIQQDQIQQDQNQQDQIQQDQPSNSSEPLVPSLEPRSDDALWNSTTHDSAHSSVGQSADRKLEAEPADAQ